MERRHGGTFVVLPGSGRPEDFDIRCTYAPSIALGEDIHDFWDTCIEHSLAKDSEAREEADHAWNWRRSAVFAKADIVSGLSSVDGCVVLDRNLRVSGFGGEILVDPARVNQEARDLRNLKTGDLMACERAGSPGHAASKRVPPRESASRRDCLCGVTGRRLADLHQHPGRRVRLRSPARLGAPVGV
jgi:hypothetical protein